MKYITSCFCFTSSIFFNKKKLIRMFNFKMYIYKIYLLFNIFSFVKITCKVNLKINLL